VILLSGAGGKTGRAVVRALIRQGAQVRALVRRPEQGDTLRKLGAADVLAEDMRSPATWEVATWEAETIYHICPNLSPHEIAIGKAALAAAVRAGVRHFVYHSVLHPQSEAMPHHWQKLRVEEAIFLSGLPFTILQPAAYMQNVLAGLRSIVHEGVYRVPYAVETRLSMVDLEDVAEAAAIVLTTAGHEGATYELAGPDVLTQSEVATILGMVLGRPVRAEAVGSDAWEREARESGLGHQAIRMLLAMLRYYERYGFRGNPHVLAWLLERSPASFEEWAVREVRDGKRA